MVPATVSNASARSCSVLVCPPGNGNVGDQAMVEAYLEHTAGQVRLIVRDRDDIQVPSEATERIEVVVLPALIYGQDRVAHLSDTRRYLELLEDASEVAVVGADIMDGAYNLTASVRRATMMRLACQAGVKARVLGFSWNAAPEPMAKRALQRAARSGVDLYLRDPVSAARARQSGLENVHAVADSVFSSTWVDESILGSVSLSPSKKIALVNISAHIQQSVDQLEDYKKIIRYLLDEDYEILLIPHVSRDTSNDAELGNRLLEVFSSEGVTAAEPSLSPAQVRALCRHASIVITGRMHLSIIALSQGVPAVVLASQGKVEGLTQLFAQGVQCVIPVKGFAVDVCDSVARLANAAPLAEDIETVRIMALDNFNAIDAIARTEIARKRVEK